VVINQMVVGTSSPMAGDTQSAGFLGSLNLPNIPPKRWIDGASATALG